MSLLPALTIDTASSGPAAITQSRVCFTPRDSLARVIMLSAPQDVSRRAQWTDVENRKASGRMIAVWANVERDDSTGC